MNHCDVQQLNVKGQVGCSAPFDWKDVLEVTEILGETKKTPACHRRLSR